MFKPGQTLGSYELIKPIGIGGFGEVWLARRKSKLVTTLVAIKLPHGGSLDLASIRREAEIWQKASGHPNVLPLIDADEIDGQALIVSEYIPDGSLDQLVKAEGPVEESKAVDIVLGILDGLAFLHSRGIVHRDIKPSNILMQGEMPRLCDFGISRMAVSSNSVTTLSLVGTIAYLSPEAIDGNRGVQSDLWAVAVVFYQLLTGELPFRASTTSELLLLILRNDPAPLGARISSGTKEFFRVAFDKSPTSRFQSALEMADQIRRLSSNTSSVSRDSDSLITRAKATSDKSHGNGETPSEDKNKSLPIRVGKKRRRKILALKIFASIITFAILGSGLLILLDMIERDRRTQVFDEFPAPEATPVPMPATDPNGVEFQNTFDSIQIENLVSSVNNDFYNQIKNDIAAERGSNSDEVEVYQIQGPTLRFGNIDPDTYTDAASLSCLGELKPAWQTCQIFIFKNVGGRFETAFKSEFGRFFEAYPITETMLITNGIISVDFQSWQKEDPICCPSKVENLSFYFNGRTLEFLNRKPQTTEPARP